MINTWILVANAHEAKILSVKNNGQEISIREKFDRQDSALKVMEKQFEGQKEAHGLASKFMEKQVEGQKEAQGLASKFDDLNKFILQQNEDPDQARRIFAKKIADFINKSHLDNEFTSLILVAEPSILGDIRKALPDTVKTKIEHELDKDLFRGAMKDADLVEKVRADLNIFAI